MDLGRVRWIAPTGLVGLTPLASVGPISLGPSAVEKSSALLPEVVVRLDVVQSLLHGKLMLQLQADRPEVSPLEPQETLDSNFEPQLLIPHCQFPIKIFR